jgi:hypothetical protein
MTGRRRLLGWRGAGQDQHLVGNLCLADPDFRAIDDIAVATAFGPCLQLRRFQAGVWLGDREAGLLLAGNDRRQHAALLLVGAVHHDRIKPEDVHVHGRRAGESRAGFGDGVHHHGGFADAEPRSAMAFRNTDAEPAIGRERAMEFVREFAIAVALEPIVIAKARADFFDRVAHRLLKF